MRADGIEYAGHTFPGYNDPIRTPEPNQIIRARREGSKVKLIRFGQQGKGSQSVRASQQPAVSGGNHSRLATRTLRKEDERGVLGLSRKMVMNKHEKARQIYAASG